ncbi:hypothetical protein [Shimazuella alba]|uniref:Uncharacterized protein n=1 Tax=Shimazuella alba TaxID=2690964 RepID=A0A6I4VZ96_9BACL|nr:hypothetical protein [Shimazuella alba]MXQ53764.1 hypothetical protein [Shimazuella alba]
MGSISSSNKLTSVYTDLSDPEHCAVGFIEYITEEHFQMKHVTSEGLEDGFVVGRIDDDFVSINIPNMTEIRNTLQCSESGAY